MNTAGPDKNPFKNSSGLAGEFFVMAELLKRGYQASFTLGNAKTVDIFSSDHKTGKTVRIQVKTNSLKPRSGNHAKWQIGRKLWDFSNESTADLIYIFVLLHPNDSSHPKYYIARTRDVIEQTKKDFERYLRGFDDRKKVYKGKLKSEQERRDYPMKDFYSVRFESDGYHFLTWDEIFS